MIIHLEVILAVGYVAFLLLLALGIELLAWSSQRGVQRTNTVGFQYHSHLSAWQCSEGNFLLLEGFDQEKRAARYRAKAQICNKCSVKHACTDSDEGRELLDPLGHWSATEIGRFHCGIALTLLILAGFFLAVGIVRHPHTGEWWVLGSCFVLVLGMVRRTLAKIREVRMRHSDQRAPSSGVSSFSP
jgi:hypothetical protein